MDNQPPIEPNQPQPQGAGSAQPGFQPRTAPVQPRTFTTAPIPPRPTFSPPPGYQPVTFSDAPQPQILPQPVVPGQTPAYPPTAQFNTPPTYQSTPAQPPKKRIIGWLLGGLIVVVALVVSALFGLRILQAQPTKAPQRVSDQFISDLQKDDPVGAYGLTSASYQKTYSDVYFKKIVDQVSKGLQGPTSVTERKVTKTTPPQAVVVYKIPTQYTTQYIKVTLENTTTWRVTSFAASTIKPELTATQ